MWYDKDIGALTGFVAVVLGFYSGANVMQYYTNQRFGNKEEPSEESLEAPVQKHKRLDPNKSSRR